MYKVSLPVDSTVVYVDSTVVYVDSTVVYVDSTVVYVDSTVSLLWHFKSNSDCPKLSTTSHSAVD